MEAMFYERKGENIQCFLCPHNCIIHPEGTGICQTRRNSGGKLITETWGGLSAVNYDPIEKKPLFHYYPGRIILSLGNVGCNMKCKCCQNWQISQAKADNYDFEREMSPPEVVQLARRRESNLGIAYTYNEPTVWFEYMNDIARLAHFEGLKNVMVSNGYINEEPLNMLMQYMDAFNIDLKGFTDDFYVSFTGARLLPVLETLKRIRKGGKHLEITFLVIPTLNDNHVDFVKMVKWIAGELGTDTVLHLSRYHPTYKLDIAPTPAGVLESMYSIAKETLSYVYVGNIQLKGHQDTRCSKCGEVVIRRTGYQVEIKSMTKQGLCSKCGNVIISNN